MKTYLSDKFDLNSLVNVLDELPLWSAPFGIKLLEFIEYKKNITALDIGFGTGFPLTEIAMRLGNTSTVYGIDPWKESIARAIQKMEAYKISNIKLIEGIAESIPLKNKSVDLITSNNGINNADDMDKAISECSRIIKSGGQFLQTMNIDKSMYEFYGALEKVLTDFDMKSVIAQMQQHIYLKRRPLDEVTQMIKKHGFIIKDLDHNQFNYKFTDGTCMLSHYFIRLAFMDSWIKILPENKIEQIFDAVESELNHQAMVTGGLKLSIPFVVINAVKS